MALMDLLGQIGSEMKAIQEKHERETLDKSCKQLDEDFVRVFEGVDTLNMSTNATFGEIIIYSTISANEKVEELKHRICMQYVKVGQPKYVILQTNGGKASPNCLKDYALTNEMKNSGLQVVVDPLAKHGFRQYVDYSLKNLSERDVIPDEGVRQQVADCIVSAMLLGDYTPASVLEGLRDLSRSKPEYAKHFNQAMASIVND